MDSTVRYAVLAATISSELSGRLAKRPAINPVPRFDALSYALPVTGRRYGANAGSA